MDTQQNIFYQSDFGCTQCWTPNYIIIRLDFLAAPLFGHMDKHLKLWYIFLRKGITVMAKQFTKVEQEILRANPFTLDVNERYINLPSTSKDFFWMKSPSRVWHINRLFVMPVMTRIYWGKTGSSTQWRQSAGRQPHLKGSMIQARQETVLPDRIWARSAMKLRSRSFSKNLWRHSRNWSL